MIRVLIADDHPVVRAGYQRLLEQGGDIRVVADAGDGTAAYLACAEHRPDVLVTDLSMPGGGTELIRRLCQRLEGLRLLVFSMHDSALLVRRPFLPPRLPRFRRWTTLPRNQKESSHGLLGFHGSHVDRRAGMRSPVSIREISEIRGRAFPTARPAALVFFRGHFLFSSRSSH